MDMNEDRDMYSQELKELLRESISRMIPGEYSPHKDDPIYITRESYPMQTKIDNLPLYPQAIPPVILSWAKLDPELERLQEDILVLDLETTGLGRGGTLAFMIGLGYYENGEFIVEQLFLPDPDAEEHSFERLQELCESHSLLITFNGKSFDLPVLESRLLYHQIWLNLRNLEHLDLLHIARRLWKRKLPSCALETIEYYVLGHIRDRELDIEGGDIPQTYFHYLMTGEADLIQRIFVHNHHDILHTAALFALICDSCHYPPESGMDPRIDYHALARLYLSQGQHDIAKRILIDMLAQGMISAEVLYELGLIYKRGQELEQALESFEIAADLQHPPSMLECAKLYEKKKLLELALSLSQRMLSLETGRYRPNDRLISKLEKRISRLQRKIAKSLKAPASQDKQSI
jgi:uncharacterized protein